MLRTPFLMISLAIGGCAAGMAPAVPAQNAAQAPAGGQGQPGQARKIIDRVSLELRVDDLSAFAAHLTDKVHAVDGYLSQSQIRQSYRYGSWTVRVPSARLSEFMAQAQIMGTVLSSQSSAEDVTEQFIDLEARLSTKRIEEERLKTLLTEQTGKLSEVLQVEKELHRVREEIEQAEGRMRSLADLTQYATVDITATVHTPIGWIPEGSLGQQMVGVFRESCRMLLQLLRTLLLGVVALIPWLILSLLLAAVTYRFWSKMRKSVVTTYYEK